MAGNREERIINLERDITEFVSEKKRNLKIFQAKKYNKSNNSVRRKTIKELQRERGIKIRESQKRIREIRISKIINSGIDFKRFGWVGKVASLIGIAPQKVHIFMKRYMPDFYKGCFIRKTRKEK